MANSSTDIKKAEKIISLTKEQERYCTELEKTSEGKKLAKEFKKGRLDFETFKASYEIIKDPNKISKLEYRFFINAVAAGKFANRSENALVFLNFISEGNDEQKASAKKFFEKISSDTEVKISQRKEKEVLKQIREEGEKTPIPNEVGTRVSAITQGVEKAKIKSEKNWTLKEASPELVEAIENLAKKTNTLANKYNQLDQELRELELSAKDKDRQKFLKEKLRELDNQIAELSNKKDKILNAHLKKNLARFRAIEEFSKKSGIDINSVKKILLSSFILLSKEEAKAKGLKLQGIYMDPSTGKPKRQIVTYEIKSISFEDDGDDISEGPGKMQIEYVDDKGKRSITNQNNFLTLLNALEAHEAIDDLETLNQGVQESTYHKDLATGQEFETDQTVLDEEGEITKEKKAFSIKIMSDRSKKIILDKEIIKTPHSKFNNSVYYALNFDRKQKEFSYGEFAKLLKQQGYKRVLTEEDDLQEIVDKQEQAYEKKVESFTESFSDKQKSLFDKIGGVEKYKLSIPEIGKEQSVIFKDESGNRREGSLSYEEGEDGEKSYYLNESDRKSDVDTLMNTVPMSMAAASAAKTGDKLFTKKKLDRPSLIEMTNKGDINDQAAQEEAAAQEAAAQEAAAQEAAAQEELAGIKAPKQSTIKAPEDKLKENIDQQYKEEALPYSEIHKIGGMTKTEQGFLKSMWANTRVITLSDLWEMGKTMWEYYQRRFDRRQKERFSSIAQNLPFFGPEMKRINQGAENEEVNQFKEFLDQCGVFEVQERLRKTSNRDEMKASFLVLSEKGQLRWDDIDMWRNINRFVHHSLAIPIPSNGDPHTKVSDKDLRTGFDFLRGAIDSLWGESMYNDWYNRNNSTFGSKLKEYYNEGAELEAVPGGHQRKLASLLAAHKRGEYIDPHEYEGLITHAIEFGKSTMQSKLYYIIEGIGAVNSDGRTILSFERIGAINTNNLTRFPLLEYLTSRHKRSDGEIHKFTIDDFKKFVSEFDGGDPMNPANCEPNERVNQFLWRNVLTSNETHNRIRKVARDMDKLDHDDMFAYMPPLDEEAITDVCQSATGRKKYLTVEGYANVFPGFSQYIRTLGEIEDKNKLAQAVISYVRFESVITNKYEKNQGGLYARLSNQMLCQKGTIVSPSTPPIAFINQLNAMVKQMAYAYSNTEYGPELNDIVERIYDIEVGDPASSEGDMALQKQRDKALKDFGNVFRNAVKSDNGDRMVQIVQSSRLEGMGYLDDATRDYAKAKFEYEGISEE